MVVRLIQGRPESVMEYSRDPIATALKWEDQGAELLHVIDLDAALGIGSNHSMIASIRKSLRIPMQVGGGVRSLEKARSLLESGIERVILGSLAFRDTDAIARLINEFGSSRIVLAIDYKQGIVQSDGWKAKTNVTVQEAIKRFTKLNVKRFLATSIERDGTLEGPDLETISKIARIRGCNILASGGVRTLDHIVELRRTGIEAVILGRALYEGQVNLKEAIATARG
jgi:phosphoribosylformimino-5-aminoimidazole carboxamide ribotide isomerase